MKLTEDTQHWQNLKPPLAPNEEEIEIYTNAVSGYKPVCLLGMTTQLSPLCDFAVDLNPIEIGKPTLLLDWRDTSYWAGAVIGDGILNLMGFEFIENILQRSEKFVCRIFLKKQEGMKYATFFPNIEDIPKANKITQTQKDIVIGEWIK